MTNEKLYEVLGDINENHIKEAREYRKAKKPVLVKWGAMAACLVVALLIVPVLQHINTPAPTISIIVNQTDYTEPYIDLDGTSYTGISETELDIVKSEFFKALKIEYDEFTNRLNDHFNLIQFGALFIPPKVDGSTQRTLHDYCFTYSTESDGQVNIAMCAFDKPLRDVIIDEAGFVNSQINDTTLKIYGTRDYFIAEFNHQNINYYITACGINIEELQTLLCDIVFAD